MIGKIPLNIFYYKCLLYFRSLLLREKVFAVALLDLIFRGMFIDKLNLTSFRILLFNNPRSESYSLSEFYRKKISYVTIFKTLIFSPF